MQKEISFEAIMSKLSYDFPNKFAVIRAVAGSLKKNQDDAAAVDDKIALIDEAVNQAIELLSTARAEVGK